MFLPFYQDNNSKLFLHKLDVVGSSPTYKNYFIVAQMGERLPKKEILSCIIGVYCQFGRRSGLGPEGRKFESCYPDHFVKVAKILNAGGKIS